MPTATTAAAAGRPLRQLQESFLAGLREADTAERLAASGLFLEPPRGTVGQRLEIYRQGYLIRLAAAIENDYPALARILGPGAFRSLARRYLAACPPAAHDVGRAGDRLACHLAGDPLTSKLPFLPDLARFEAALAAAVVAADLPPVSRQAFAALGPDRLLDLEVTLAPGAALLRSEWPVGDLWACRDRSDEEIAIEVFGRPSQIVIYRDGLAVRWRELTAEEAEFVGAAARGTTLAELLECERFGPPEEAAPRLVALFLRLVESSIVRVPLSETPPGVSPSSKESHR
jgi:hypothetical protein